jgi:hypothetical protein
MTTELQTKLVKWLNTQGYPLEMYVAQSFQKANFWVTQSDFYVDPDSGKSREIDVVAHRVTEIPAAKGVIQKSGNVLQVLIGCSIECKLAQNKPWVLFSGDKEYELHPGYSGINSAIGDQFLYTVSEGWKEHQSLPLFKPRRFAYGITQGFGGNEDTPYQAIQGTVKAAVGFANRVDDATKQAKEKYPLSITFSAIVIDGNLFEAYLDEKGEMVIKEVEFGTLYWKGTIASRPSSVIYIVTKSALSTFIDQVSITSDSYVHLIKQDESLLKEMIYTGKEFQKAK